VSEANRRLIVGRLKHKILERLRNDYSDGAPESSKAFWMMG
jgi:hypothetical protein